MNMKKVVVIGMAGLMSLSVAACGNSSSTSSKDTNDTISSNSSTESISSTAESVKKSYNIGESVENNGLNITFESCETNWTGYSQYSNPKDGNKIIRAYFSFENKSTKDRSVSTYNFKCYADGSACDSYWGNSTASDTLGTNTLSPDRKTNGYVYFEVPINASKIELEYDNNIFTNNDKIVFNIT